MAQVFVQNKTREFTSTGALFIICSMLVRYKAHLLHVLVRRHGESEFQEHLIPGKASL